MKLVYWNNIPAPYMVDRFNRLADLGGVDFEAWFSRRTEPDRTWQIDESAWRFPYQYVGTSPFRATGRAARLLRDRRPDVLFSLYEKPEYAATVLHARACGIPVVLHAMRTFDAWRPRSRRREISKRLLFPCASRFYVPGPDAAAYVAGYGVSEEKITILPEPVEVGRFRPAVAIREQRPADGGGCQFIYVGRLWRYKGLDYLFDAYEAVVRRVPNVSLRLVGDGLDETRYRARARSLPRVTFAGYIRNEGLPEEYAAADVVVFPTLGDPYGHVVQEAMASARPVISTTSAGDISDRVLHGKTGLLVPAADSGALADAMLTLAGAPQMRETMGAAGFERIKSRTNGWWVAQIEAVARAAMA